MGTANRRVTFQQLPNGSSRVIGVIRRDVRTREWVPVSKDDSGKAAAKRKD